MRSDGDPSKAREHGAATNDPSFHPWSFKSTTTRRPTTMRANINVTLVAASSIDAEDNSIFIPPGPSNSPSRCHHEQDKIPGARTTLPRRLYPAECGEWPP